MSKVRRRDALEFHRAGRPGKIEVVPTKPLNSQRDLSLAYSPGVAEPCMEIFERPSEVFEYTARGNLVAVITNGTAVLGLGDIGALASKPVMEGKGVLFKKFAGIDVFDLELDVKDPDKFIEIVAALEPTFGGINLEDIAAPECFYIEEELKRRMKIPVFHDDQHGTAIISGAALINAAELQGKPLESLTVVVSGAGASAVACTKFYVSLGVKAENILMCDSKGVLHHEREKLSDVKQEFVRRTDKRTLADALEGADVFLGLSKGGLVTGEMVRSMADRPIVFALANPDPEIPYDEAKAARPDAIVATGRSDTNNQVNNVLGFPGIFRGALDVRATGINEAMKVAAAHALAELARKEVPEVVSQAYRDEFKFGPEYIIPKPFDPRVIQWVAPAVATAAVESGLAQVDFDPVAYRETLRGLDGSSGLMRRFVRAARRSPRRLVFPEGANPTILRACSILIDDGIALPVLLGNADRIRQIISEHDIDIELDQVEIIDPNQSESTEEFAQIYFEKRARKGITMARAQAHVRRPMFFGMMLVEHGDADGIVAGADYPYPETIRPALEVIGLAPGARRVAGMYMMLTRQGVVFFGDTTVNTDSRAEVLADVAEMVADAAKDQFEVEPRVAFLSYSNFGSVRSDNSARVRKACELLRERRPELEADGEMQANVAVNYELQRRNFPFSRLTGPANVLVFPTLEAGNTAYKLMRELGGVTAVGPVLLGMARPVTVLEQDCTVDNIVHMSALTVVQAQIRERERSRMG